jgi:uncharacterized membrane protein
MGPLLLVLAGVLAFRLLGAFGIGPWTTWRMAMVPALATMFAVTGAAHFTPLREELARLLPKSWPWRRFLVAAAGAIQVAAGAALLVTSWRATAAGVLIALLLLKLPANWNASRRGGVVHGPFPTPAVLRLPLVAAWIGALAWIAGVR